MNRAARALFVLLPFLASAGFAFGSDLLCISTAGTEADCRVVTGDAPIEVTPSPTRRQAVWIAEDQSRVVVFSIAATATLARVPATGSEIRYAVNTRKLPRGARTVEYELTDLPSGNSWRWTLSGRAAAGTIRVPNGRYTLRVAADHARPAITQKISAGGGKTVDAGILELVPKLVVTGKLVDAQGEPIIGGTVSDEPGTLTAVSGSDGAFTIDAAAEELPASLMAQAEGYVTREIAIPDRRESLHAGNVVLDRGVPLSVKVTMKGDQAMPDGTSIAVYALTRDRSRRLVERQQLPADRSVVTFRRLGEGKHIVEVAGPQPLQRRALAVDLPTEGGVQEIVITPRTLSGHVYYGTEALRDAAITLYPRNQLWEARQDLGEEGEFGGPLWDDGVFGAMVEGGRLTIPFPTDKDITLEHEEWDVIVPDNGVRGHVRDGKTNRGIAGARVSYESLGAMRLSSMVRTDEQGRYEITGIPEGKLSIRAAATGYLTSEPVTVQIRAGERGIEQVLALEPGVVLTVRIADALDQPIAGATIVDPIMGPSRFVTNARGEASIPVGLERPRRVWIVPREGSLLAATLEATQSQPARIVIPSATGSIRMVVREDDEAPIGGLRFVVAYNGEIVPDAVWRIVAQAQGFDWITDAAGVTRHPRLPPGTYEFWPYMSAPEGRNIASTPGITAPVARVRLNAGDDQSVTVTVKRDARFHP